MMFMPMFSYRMLWRAITRGLPTKLMTVQLLLQFCIVLPLLCGQLPGSAYYFGNQAIAGTRRRSDTAAAASEARAFLDQLGGSRWKYHRVPDDSRTERMGLNLTIGLLTSSADGGGLLPVSAHALLEAVNLQSKIEPSGHAFASIRVYICSEDGVVSSALASWGVALPVLGPRPNRTGLSNQREANRIPKRHAAISSSSSSIDQKAAELWCLSAVSAADTSANYLAVVPHHYLAKRHAIREIEKLLANNQKKLSSKSSALIVALQSFVSDNDKFFPASLSSLLELFCLTACLTLLPYAAYYRQYVRPMSPLSNGGLAVFLIGQALLTVLAVGRPNWRSLGRRLLNSYSNPNSLSSAAVSTELYSWPGVPFLVSRSAAASLLASAVSAAYSVLGRSDNLFDLTGDT